MKNRAVPAVLLTCLFLAAVLLVNGNMEWFYQAAYSAEGVFQRSARRLSGNYGSPGDGTVSRGNLYPAGTRQMEVRVSEKPEDTIYLRGFAGGDYDGDEWQPADDDAVFERMEDNTLHWGIYEDWIPGMFESLYFTMNLSTERETPAEARVIWIDQRADTEEEWYTPYFSMWNRWEDRQRTEAESRNEYAFLYFEADELEIDWEHVLEGTEGYRDWYYETQVAYMREIPEFYTKVPEEDLPRLAQLCGENPAGTPEEATAFILSVLQENMTYTQTPGLFPFNEDPVEYFLFEGREGYCQHFASAAVLMYRLYGIPARYATGYAVTPSMFTEQADGTWAAEVTDEAAHAWAEIFQEDYGWVPVEVTPSGNGGASSYAGMDTGLLESLLEGQSWNLGLLQEADPPAGEAAETETESGQEPEQRQGAVFSLRLPDRETLAEGAVCLLLLALLAALICRLVRLWELENMDVRGMFGKIRKAVRFAGFPEQYGDFEER